MPQPQEFCGTNSSCSSLITQTTGHLDSRITPYSIHDRSSRVSDAWSAPYRVPGSGRGFMAEGPLWLTRRRRMEEVIPLCIDCQPPAQGDEHRSAYGRPYHVALDVKWKTATGPSSNIQSISHVQTTGQSTTSNLWPPQHPPNEGERAPKPLTHRSIAVHSKRSIAQL